MSTSYRISHYKLIDRMEKNHFWYTERNHIIRMLLSRFIHHPKGKRFLEIGCGTGILLPLFENLGFSVTGLDINKEALLYAKTKSNARLVRSSLFSYTEKEKYDSIGMFDVLEHQTNDQKFLSICSGLLKTQGYLFLSVPSHRWLWNSIDVLWGHKRRYEQSDLTEKLEKAGFTVCFSNYWNTLLFGWYILWRLQFLFVKKSFLVHQYSRIPIWPVNQICRFVLHMEHLFFPFFPFPFGSSLIMVAKKI